jgi:hypothetical protein
VKLKVRAAVAAEIRAKLTSTDRGASRQAEAGAIARKHWPD